LFFAKSVTVSPLTFENDQICIAPLFCCLTSLLSAGPIQVSDSAITSLLHFQLPSDHDIGEIPPEDIRNHCLPHELKGSNLPCSYMAQYLLSLLRFSRSKNLRFEDHTCLLPAPLVGVGHGKIFTDKVFIGTLICSFLTPLPSTFAKYSRFERVILGDPFHHSQTTAFLPILPGSPRRSTSL